MSILRAKTGCEKRMNVFLVLFFTMQAFFVQEGWGTTVSPFDVQIGQDSAPVTIIEYSSLNCGHCAEFHEHALPLLKEHYIDKGKVKLIFKHFPLDEQAVEIVAILSGLPKLRQLTAIQTLFQNQQKWVTDRSHQEVAKLLQIDYARSLKLSKDQKIINDILKLRLDHQNQLKITATPTFFINGKAYPYALKWEELDAILNPKKHKAGA